MAKDMVIAPEIAELITPRRGSTGSYHVALDTMMGRRSRLRPEEVVIDGFLLLDTGEYQLAIAHMPLEVFWKMKALDIVGHVRTANRARAAHPRPYPEVGSVWLVDADLDRYAPTVEKSADQDVEGSGAHTASRSSPGTTAGQAGQAVASDEPIFRISIRTVHALERVAIERLGPRFIEALHVRELLPAFIPD